MGESKDLKVLLSLLFLLAALISLIGGLEWQENSIRNTKAGEEYNVLSITAPQGNSMDIGVRGEISSDEDEQVILILKSQKNRIVVENTKQNEIPTNLSVNDLVVCTKNGQLKIIN